MGKWVETDSFQCWESKGQAERRPCSEGRCPQAASPQFKKTRFGAPGAQSVQKDWVPSGRMEPTEGLRPSSAWDGSVRDEVSEDSAWER